MAFLQRSIRDIDISIHRKIMNEICKQMMTFTSIRKKEQISVHYRGESKIDLEVGSYFDDRKNRNLINYGDHSKVIIEVSENVKEDLLLDTFDYRKEEVPLLLDEDLDFYLRPEYLEYEVDMSFTYRAASENEMNEWVNRIRDKMTRGMAHMVHESNYEILLNDEFLLLLKEIHDKKENRHGNGEKFFDFIYRLAKGNCDIRAKHNVDEEMIFTFPQSITPVLGSFDLTSPPKPVKSEVGSFYESTVSYKFEYKKPVALVAHYPIVIHNQMISKEWLYSKSVKDPSKENDYVPVTKRRFLDFLKKVGHIKNDRLESYIYPEIDTWVPKNQSDRYISLFRTIIQLREEDPGYLLDLKKLGKFELTEKFKEKLLEHKDKLFKYLDWIFHINVFSNHDVLDPTKLYLSDDLVLRTTQELDYTKVHRVIISALSDMSMLPVTNLEVLRKDSQLFLEHIVNLDPTIIEKNIKLDYYNNGKSLTPDSFKKVLGALNNHQLFKARWNNSRAYLVNNVIVRVEHV